MNYIAIWPGQPGGYMPTVAEKLLEEPGVQSRAKEAQGFEVKHRNCPPKPVKTTKPRMGIVQKPQAKAKRQPA